MFYWIMVVWAVAASVGLLFLKEDDEEDDDDEVYLDVDYER